MNLCAACPECNISKGATEPEWLPCTELVDCMGFSWVGCIENPFEMAACDLHWGPEGQKERARLLKILGPDGAGTDRCL